MPTSTAAPPADPISRVKRVAEDVRSKTADRDVAIVTAHRTGATIAALARAADLDVGTVRRIIKRHQ